MSNTSNLTLPIKIIIAFNLLNVVLWTFGQGYAVIDYDTVAEWDLQARRDLLNPAIVEVNRGIGLADMITLIPLFIIGTIGLWKMRFFGAVASWMAYGITLYWPVVFWCSQLFYGQEGIKYEPTTPEAIIVPVIFILTAAWASWYLYKNHQLFE